MNAGERMARERVEALCGAADRLSPDDLWSAVPPHREPDRHATLLAEVETLATRYGRGRLLAEARARVRDALTARATEGRMPEGGLFGVLRGARPEDQAAAVVAVLDAVAAAVVEDALSPADAAELANPGRAILAVAPLPVPGDEASDGDDEPRWEPTPLDWAAAEVGSTAIGGDPGPTARALDPDRVLGPAGISMAAVVTAVVAVASVIAALVIGASLMNGIAGIALAAALALGWVAVFRYRPDD